MFSFFLFCVDAYDNIVSKYMGRTTGLPFGKDKPKSWFWIVSLDQVYLWDGQKRRLLKGCGDFGIVDLAAYYLVACHGLDFFKSNSVDAGAGGAVKKKSSFSSLGNGSKNDAVMRVKLTDFGHAVLATNKRKFGDLATSVYV